MFKTTALLTMLTLGASASIAMAAPRQTYDRRTGVESSRVADHRTGAGSSRPVDHRSAPARPSHAGVERVQLDRAADRFTPPGRFDSDRDRRELDDIGPRHYRPSWIALSAPLALTRAGQCIEVRDPGTFTQLRLQSDAGIAEIDRVIVQFANGSQQVAELDRSLDQRGEFVELALDGNNRRVDRVTVTGATGDLQVFAI